MILTILLLSGCGKVQYPDLPNNAIAFKMGSFEDKDHDKQQHPQTVRVPEICGVLYDIWKEIRGSQYPVSIPSGCRTSGAVLGECLPRTLELPI